MSPKKVRLPLDVYVRVSDVRGRSGESFISPKDQEDRCRALAKSRGFQIGEVFTDLDVSGSKMSRPQLDEAIRRIEAGVSSGILVAKLDRFARTLVGGLQTLERINELGGVVIIADGEFDTSTATGELVLNMMLSLAQFELRRIGDNWSSAQRRAVERGIHVSRFVPPGYRRGSDKILEPDPQHAKTLRKAFEMAKAGESYVRIADMLTAAGFPSGGEATTWKSNRIARLLANRVYLGEARYGDVTNPDAHKALVPRETWVLAQRKPAARTLTSSDHLLAGICRCASCMYGMRFQPSSGKSKPSYRCQTLSASGRCPHPSSVAVDRLDDYVIEQFLAAAGSTTLEPVEPEAADMSEAIIAAERAYQDVLTSPDLASIPAADRARMVAAYYDEWQALLAELPPAQTPKHPALGSVDLPTLVAQLRAGGRTQELRELLSSAIAAVFVRPAVSRAKNLPIADRVKIVFHGDEELVLPSRGARFEPRVYVW